MVLVLKPQLADLVFQRYNFLFEVVVIFHEMPLGE